MADEFLPPKVALVLKANFTMLKNLFIFRFNVSIDVL